jgi:SAM-dependent methyltransferase
VDPVERHPIFAALYDTLMGALDRISLAPLRKKTASAARGRTLEIGIGTGLNLALYDAASPIFGIEPDPDMLKRARARVAGKPVHLVIAGAEALPFREGAFDSVVASLVFCTIPDVDAAAREVRRVLRPESGEFHFFEHVRAKARWAGRLQDAAAPLWRQLFAGCHPNRDTVPAFERAGLAIERFEQRSAILVQGRARSAR